MNLVVNVCVFNSCAHKQGEKKKTEMKRNLVGGKRNRLSLFLYFTFAIASFVEIFMILFSDNLGLWASIYVLSLIKM